MPAAGVAVLAVVLAGAAAALPIRRAAVVLVGTALLLPATWAPPLTTSPPLFVARVVAVSFVVGVVVRVATGRLPAAVLRPHPLHAVFGIWLVVWLADGIALAEPALSLEAAVAGWWKAADGLVFFVAALAAGRVLGAGRLAIAIAGCFAVVALIAVIERATGGSWARWLFSDLPGQAASVAAMPLERRGGVPRSRAAANFALELGWLAAMALPLCVAVALRARRLAVAAGGPLLLVLTVFLTGSRTPLLALPLAAVAIVLAGRPNRRVVAAVLGSVVLAFVVLTAVPSLRAPFERGGAAGSVDIRRERFPAVAAVAAGDPLTGRGAGALAGAGIPVADASYLVDYAELGAVGLSVRVVLVGAAVGAAVPALRARRGDDRLLAAGVVTGLVLGLFGAAAYDLFHVGMSLRCFWLLAAVGLCLREEVRPDSRLRLTRARAAAATLGLVIGALLAVAAPSQGVATGIIEAVPTQALLDDADPTADAVGDAAGRACAAATAGARVTGASATCRVTDGGLGLARLRVEGGDVDTAAAARAVAAGALVAAVPGAQLHPTGTVTARPAWATTAPAWLGIGWAGAVLLTAGRRRQGSKRSPSSGWTSPRPRPTATPASRAASAAAPVSSPARAARHS